MIALRGFFCSGAARHSLESSFLVKVHDHLAKVPIPLRVAPKAVVATRI